MRAVGGAEAEASAGSGAETVRPLARGLTLLRTLGAPGRGRTSPGELVRATGLARATVDRLVSTLLQLDYLRLDDGDIALGPRLAELGDAYLTSTQLPRLLQPHLDALAEAFDEPVCLTVPDQDGVRIVARASRHRVLSPTFHVGDLLPPGRSAAAPLFSERYRGPARDAAMAAELLGPFAPEAGRPGVDWAVDNEALEPGLLAVAVPLRAPGGEVCGAVTATTQTNRHDLASLCRRALPRLRETVAAAERAYAARLTDLRRRRLPGPIGPGERLAGAQVPLAGRGAQPRGSRLRRAEPRGAETAAEVVRATKERLGADFLQSLARGLAVITAFDAEHHRLTLSEAAQLTGLPRATVRRSLLTLRQHGYATARGRLFHLLPRVLELGYPAVCREREPWSA